MQLPSTTKPTLDQLSFHIRSIDHISVSFVSQQWDWIPTLAQEEEYVWIYVIQGQGTAIIQSQSVPWSSGKSWIIRPGREIHFNLTGIEHMELYVVTFDVINHTQRVPECYDQWFEDGAEEIIIYPPLRLQQQLDDLYQHYGQKDSTSLKQLYAYDCQLLFQQMFRTVLEARLSSNRWSDVTQAVQSTINIIHLHYAEEWTVNRLSLLSDVPIWQYSTIFQTLTGFKPLEYLTQLRVEKAKQLLLTFPKRLLREIALEVGFKDEYYFSRQFRKLEGLTPKQYTRHAVQRVMVRDWTGHQVQIPLAPQRIIYYGDTLGDLLVLGIIPVGSNLSDHTQVISPSIYKQIVEIGFPVDIEKVKTLSPDVIIFSHTDENKYDQLSAIAPTLTFNSWDRLDHRLQLLGQWFNRSKEADKWLSSYHREVTQMWSELQAIMATGTTASVLTIEQGTRLFVMGNIGLSSWICHHQGFEYVPAMRRVIEAQRGYKEIEANHLVEYTGDYIFMLLSAEPQAREEAYRLINSPLWQNLKAVRNRNVYVLEANPWNYGDAYTQKKLINQFKKMLLTVDSSQQIASTT